MKLAIDEVDYKDENFERIFWKNFELQKPLLIHNIDSFDAKKLTPEFVKANFLNEDKRSAGWFDADLPQEDVMGTPDFIQKLLKRDDIATRESPMRVFMQPGGHRTLPHYDGNSLYGFNVQITGKKRWIITSPMTPLPTMPFLFVGMVPTDFEMDEQQYDFHDFETHPGDMICLPPYWYHEVHSLGEINLNMNWVVTPREPNQTSPLGRREVEIVKLRDSLSFINKLYPDDFNHYGGAGKPLVQAYIRGVGVPRMITRLLKEIFAIPRFLILARQIKSSANNFSKNNFNVN